MNRRNKPRVRKLKGRDIWNCVGSSFRGVGTTPHEAYTDWRTGLDRWNVNPNNPKRKVFNGYR